MTDAIMQKLVKKIEEENERIEIEDKEIYEIALNETETVYSIIWEAIIEKLNISKDYVTITGGIFDISNFQGAKRKEYLEMAKGFNKRHKDKEILITNANEKEYFVLKDYLRTLLENDGINVQIGCKSKMNMWKYEIKVAELMKKISSPKQSSNAPKQI